MTALTVCAVIVTHHPSIEMIENMYQDSRPSARAGDSG